MRFKDHHCTTLHYSTFIFGNVKANFKGEKKQPQHYSITKELEILQKFTAVMV